MPAPAAVSKVPGGWAWTEEKRMEWNGAEQNGTEDNRRSGSFKKVSFFLGGKNYGPRGLETLPAPGRRAGAARGHLLEAPQLQAQPLSVDALVFKFFCCLIF